MSGFLDRWSRRKGEEGRKDEEGRSAPPAEDLPESPAEGTSGQAEEPLLSDEILAALPRIDELTPESSLAPFLRPGVPSALKNAAMRKMWLLTPAIRDHKDCAVDYHWDWNTPGGVPGAGGRISPDAVQKMLQGLRGPGPRPVEPPEAAPDAGHEAVAEASPDAEPAEDTEAGLTEEPAAQASPTVAPERAQESVQDRSQGRRHGGAMPG